MKYREAYYTPLLSIRHVAPFILGTAAQGAGVPLIFGQYRILVVEYDNAPSAYLAFQIDGSHNL